MLMPYLAHLHVDAVQVDDGIDGIQRAGLPDRDLFADGVRHR